MLFLLLMLLIVAAAIAVLQDQERFPNSLNYDATAVLAFS